MSNTGKAAGALVSELNQLQRDYDRLGLKDPFFWTVGNSSKDIDSYFASGRQQVVDILSHAEKLGIELKRGRALDFACGMGRVTQALVNYYDQIHGLDISPSMIALANRHNADPARCHFHMHCSDRLDMFTADFFDVVVAVNVLPYISPVLSKVYLREFVRVLKSGGLLYFETSSATVWRRMLFPKPLLRMWRKLKHRKNPITCRADRFHFPKTMIATIISEAKGKVLRVDDVPRPTLWTHHNFFVTKR